MLSAEDTGTLESQDLALDVSDKKDYLPFQLLAELAPSHPSGLSLVSPMSSWGGCSLGE